MARDYAKPTPQPKRRPTRNQRAPQRQRFPLWAVFAGGVGAGVAVALVGLLLWWSNSGEQPEAAAAPDAKAPTEDHDLTKPRFDFYTLLKESEVFVPEGEEPTPPTPAPAEQQQDATADGAPPSPAEPTAPVAEQPAYEFVLQVGSFRSRSEADEMRARLLLLGLNAGLESTAGPGEVWHRVMIGPFDSPAGLAQARARLQANGVDHIPVKRKQP